MDIDPDNDGGDSSYNGESHRCGFCPGTGRKRKALSSSIQMMVNERRQRTAHQKEISRYKAQLRQWLNDIKWSHQVVPSTYRDSATALLVIFNLMLENVDLTQTEAVAKAGLYLDRGPSALCALVAHWHEYKEIHVESDTRGGSLGNQSTELFMSLPHFIITTIMDRRAEGHHGHYGWYVDSANRYILSGTGAGKRLIIVHAITSDGLLHKIDSSTNKTISAELIYEANNPFGDYHSNMDGYNFRLSVDQHLFPVFQAKYGYEKRMILVLDNAPYHKEQGEAVKLGVPGFHYFILTPPYTPQLQPIEWIWSYAKGYVAKQFTSSRTVQQLIEQTRAGFYGDDGEHEGISIEMVRNMIAHAHTYCDILIDDDPLLEGSINNLKNVKNYEEAYEEEENEDEADDINIEIDDNIE
ncbi:unnamed protein product [Rotaria sordida]|uniref:Tc1-like transposase DDE domain-containing protein n=1 Tax=Rotaria sordida TaxID=392033 RepID=A0A819QTG3_9BILA|nr:unnamed protein product [Rotaria sordida]CAF4036176.1 unnamed protein product [Rotaria sordida]